MIAEETGQSTTEYALVTFGTIALATVLWCFVKAGERRVFGRLATVSASHAVLDGGVLHALVDALLY